MRDLGQEWVAAQARGDFAEGWRISDTVLAARDPAGRDDPRLPYHRRWVWDGTAPDGRDVLVRCYHGLGDTLQFARFLPALAARAAGVRVEVQAELLPVLRQLPGVREWIAFDAARPVAPSGCDIEIMELSHALRLAPDDVAVPYLRALGDGLPLCGGGSVGVCTRAGGWDSARSLPAGWIEPLLAGRTIVDLAPAVVPATMVATARAIAGLDLVISVDTAVAHLAGALGRPGFVLLKHAPDWRWRGSRERSAWYPSLRLFRQSAPGDWAGPLARAAAALTSFDSHAELGRRGRAAGPC